MAKELTTISPEGLEIANSYLQYGNIRGVCEYLQVPETQVVEVLNKRDVLGHGIPKQEQHWFLVR